MKRKRQNVHLHFTEEDLKKKGFRNKAILTDKSGPEQPEKRAGQKLVFDQENGKVIAQRFGKQNHWKTVVSGLTVNAVKESMSGVNEDSIASDTLKLAEGSAEETGRQLKKQMYSRKLKELTEEEYREQNGQNQKAQTDKKYNDGHGRTKDTSDTEESSNPISRWLQKKKIKEGYQSTENGKTAGSGAAAGENAMGSIAGNTAGEAAAGEAAEGATAAGTSGGLPIVLIILLVVLAIILLLIFGTTIIGLFFPSGNGTVVTTSYTADDGDIIGANTDYTNLEKGLQQKIDRMETDHPGYDEYRYNMAEIGHDPYQLTAFLTVKKEAFKRAEVQELLRQLFEKEYVLTLQEVTETRYRTVHDSDGTSHRESYEWHVLVIRLQNKGIDGAVSEMGLDSDEQSRYEILTDTKGNRDYLFGEDVYVPDNTIDTGDTRYEVPAEALTDEEFGQLYQEAKRYLGMAYVWGGSSPSTGFDCSGYVCWCINHSGYGHVGRTTANGLLSMCSRIGSNEAKPGDLIFFQGTYATSGASHVGIYIGGNRMIHCGNPIKISSINTSYWNRHYLTFGRLKEEYR